MKGWGTHLPVLMRAMALTDGPVLELGAGLYSTPYLHWACFPSKRKLVSYDNDPKYFSYTNSYAEDFHEVILVSNWDDIDIEKPWDVVLVDHGPAERRIEEIRKLAPYAKYIIVHDTQRREEKYYRYDLIRPLFKYVHICTEVSPETTVFSNLVDLTDFHL